MPKPRSARPKASTMRVYFRLVLAVGLEDPRGDGAVVGCPSEDDTGGDGEIFAERG